MSITFVLSACASPFIYDVQTDKVVVQSQGDNEATMQTDNEGCGIYGRKAIGPLSYRCLDGYCINKAYLFACKEAQEYGAKQTLSIQ